MRLFGQFALVMAVGAILIAAVIGVFYGISMLVLLAVSRLLPLRGRSRHNSHEGRAARVPYPRLLLCRQFLQRASAVSHSADVCQGGTAAARRHAGRLDDLH